jgi:TetR/AcrR family transcriptional repressor of nem operon
MATRNTDSARANGSAATRARILASADRLFADRGFDGVTMPMIAQASGITAGAIYKHFKGKAELFFEVVRRAVQSAPVAPEGVALDVEALPEIIASYTERRMKRVRQLAIEMHAASTKDAQIRRLLKRTLEAQIGGIRDGLAAAQAAGVIEPGLEPNALAHAVFVMIMGLTHLETFAPQLVGDATWRDFIRARATMLIGLREPGAADAR